MPLNSKLTIMYRIKVLTTSGNKVVAELTTITFNDILYVLESYRELVKNGKCYSLVDYVC